MWNYVIYGGIGGLLLLWLLRSRGPSVLRVVREAEDQQDIKPIVDAAANLSGKKRSFFFQHCIELLWQKWERELVAQLVVQFATLHPDEKLPQYWIQKVLDCEPKAAESNFSTSFLSTHYQPDVAATCGVASS